MMTRDGGRRTCHGDVPPFMRGAKIRYGAVHASELAPESGDESRALHIRPVTSYAQTTWLPFKLGVMSHSKRQLLGKLDLSKKRAFCWATCRRPYVECV